MLKKTASIQQIAKGLMEITEGVGKDGQTIVGKLEAIATWASKAKATLSQTYEQSVTDLETAHMTTMAVLKKQHEQELSELTSGEGLARSLIDFIQKGDADPATEQKQEGQG